MSHELAGRRFELCAYLVRHPRGVLLWETGIGEHEEVERIGQSFNFASDYANARLAQELLRAGRIPEADADYPPWMDVVGALDSWNVLFAHDVALWERGPQVPP